VPSKSAVHDLYDDRWWTPEPWWDWVVATLGVPREDIDDPSPEQRGERDGANWRPRRAASYHNWPGGQIDQFYPCFQRALSAGQPMILCMFNAEMLGRMPLVVLTPGWLLRPLARVAFIWGGEDLAAQRRGGKITRKARKHGEPCKAPTNHSLFWSSVSPSAPPVPCIVSRTGPDVCRIMLPVQVQQ
jgi:hypothetical protein